jgi:hypothetical protein
VEQQKINLKLLEVEIPHQGKGAHFLLLQSMQWYQILMGCCPIVNLFECSLKRFLFINLGEVKEKAIPIV